MNDYLHVHEKFRHVMQWSDQERIAFIKQPRWVDYDMAKRILDGLEELLNEPVKERIANVLIVGRSNLGKTTLVKRFFEKYGEPWIDDDTGAVKPIVFVQAPPGGKEKDLYLEILDRFYAPFRATESSAALRAQVVHLLREHRVRMLIVDELQHLLSGQTVRQRNAIDSLKFLCNEVSVSIVGVGTQEAVNVLHADDQHTSRFFKQELKPWSLDVGFQRFLANYQRVLPLKQPSEIAQPELASLIHSLSDGMTGEALRLVASSAKHAITSGKELIDRETIEKNARPVGSDGFREFVT